VGAVGVEVVLGEGVDEVLAAGRDEEGAAFEPVSDELDAIEEAAGGGSDVVSAALEELDVGEAGVAVGLTAGGIDADPSGEGPVAGVDAVEVFMEGEA
jgi:hypothetical protein